METSEAKCTTKCGCPCHRMAGIFIVLIGVAFLLGNLGVISEHAVGIAWPVLLILAGLKKTFRGMCKCCSGEKCGEAKPS